MNELLITSVNPKPPVPVLTSATVGPEQLPVLPSESPTSSPDPREDIRVRAETVSSLLRGIPEYRPRRHWGIND